MSQAVSTGEGAGPVALLRWPPPGLERMQGDLAQIAARAALAGGLLVVPMLFVVARQQGFATLGPLGDAWWITIVLASVGLAFAIDALVRAGRLARRASQALARGYDLATVSHVVSDSGRDMGFLLRGARHFGAMDERERDMVARLRVLTALLNALSGLWLGVALALGLLAAARGWLSPTALWMGTLVPSAAGYGLAGVGRLIQEARVRRARRAFHGQPWGEDLVKEEIAAWQVERWGRKDPPAATTRPLRDPARMLWRIGLVTSVLAAVVALPILTLIPTSAVGPILSMIATPQFDRARHRAAVMEALRPYRVATDASISPQEAGQLLHDIIFVGTTYEPATGEKAPSKRVTQTWLPDIGPETPMGLDPFAWGDSLLEAVGRGTTGAQRSYLAQVAAHPASADFSRLARAADLDAASARWVDPIPQEITIATMPIPRYVPLRAAVQAHIGTAAYALSQDDPERAERLLAEVISVGLLLSDFGPSLIDNFLGFALAESGGRALEDLYSATGDVAALERLVELRQAAERAASRIPQGGPQGTENWVRSLPEMVLDTTAVRGLRWEYFVGVTTVTPCLNLHRIVFGPDAAYTTFLERAHESLVRWPSEEGLFERARVGWLGTLQIERETMLSRLLGLAMRRGSGACGDVLRRVGTAQAIF